MKFQIQLGVSKSHLIVFFSGYQKQSNWNQSEYGKELNIITQLKQYSHIQVDFEPIDYSYSIPELSQLFINQLSTLTQFNRMKIVIVGHSYGCFLAINLAQTIKSVCGLVLLDPIVRDQTYWESLQSRLEDPNSAHKIKHWDQFPAPKVSISTAVRVHLAQSDLIKTRLDYFLPMCTPNTNSVLQVHACSHMIHYDLPWLVIKEVKQLIKLR